MVTAITPAPALELALTSAPFPAHLPAPAPLVLVLPLALAVAVPALPAAVSAPEAVSAAVQAAGRPGRCTDTTAGRTHACTLYLRALRVCCAVLVVVLTAVTVVAVVLIARGLKASGCERGLWRCLARQPPPGGSLAELGNEPPVDFCACLSRNQPDKPVLAEERSRSALDASRSCSASASPLGAACCAGALASTSLELGDGLAEAESRKASSGGGPPPELNSVGKNCRNVRSAACTCVPLGCDKLSVVVSGSVMTSAGSGRGVYAAPAAVADITDAEAYLSPRTGAGMANRAPVRRLRDRARSGLLLAVRLRRGSSCLLRGKEASAGPKVSGGAQRARTAPLLTPGARGLDARSTPYPLAPGAGAEEEKCLLRVTVTVRDGHGGGADPGRSGTGDGPCTLPQGLMVSDPGDPHSGATGLRQRRIRRASR